jgi:hypothetical protein
MLQSYYGPIISYTIVYVYGLSPQGYSLRLLDATTKPKVQYAAVLFFL